MFQKYNPLHWMNCQNTMEKMEKKAYIAYKGQVYDVTDVLKWKDGKHHGQKVGMESYRRTGRGTSWKFCIG